MKSSEEKVNFEDINFEVDNMTTEHTENDVEADSEWKKKYTYLLAEFDNYRKRVNREKAELINSANKDVILDLLSIVDDMERLNSQLYDGDLEENSDPLKTGFRIIFENTMKLLDAEGCTMIKCSHGDEFDVNIHESISARVEDGVERGKVLNVFQNGWILNGKLLRPAKVCVSK